MLNQLSIKTVSDSKEAVEITIIRFINLTDVPFPIVILLCDTSLHLTESLHLHVKDLDFEMNLITVRDGKEAKDHTTLPFAIDGKHSNQRIERRTTQIYTHVLRNKSFIESPLDG